MANRKEPDEKEKSRRPDGKHLSEGSPNPHGEAKILEMPVRTHQGKETAGKNVPQVPNTIGGNFNPSVTHDFQNRVVKDKNAADKAPRAPTPIKKDA